MNNYLIAPECSRWMIIQAENIGEVMNSPEVDYCHKHQKGYIIIDLSANEVVLICSSLPKEVADA